MDLWRNNQLTASGPARPTFYLPNRPLECCQGGIDFAPVADLLRKRAGKKSPLVYGSRSNQVHFFSGRYFSKRRPSSAPRAFMETTRPSRSTRMASGIVKAP